MKATHRASTASALAIAVAFTLGSGIANAADEAAAKALARQSNCFTCHAIDKAKVGPAWQAVAAKYKGKADAEAKIVKQLTTGKVEKDGKLEDHATAKSSDPAAVKNLADWILSL